MMRRVALAAALALLFVGLTLPAAAEAKGKTHDISTEVVAVDVQARTITIKDEKGQDMTASVLESAIEDLKKVKTGDKVIVTCQDNEKGEHVAVIAIKPAKA